MLLGLFTMGCMKYVVCFESRMWVLTFGFQFVCMCIVVAVVGFPVFFSFWHVVFLAKSQPSSHGSPSCFIFVCCATIEVFLFSTTHHFFMALLGFKGLCINSESWTYLFYTYFYCLRMKS